MSTKIYDTPRLAAIRSKISSETIADIGTDHAYIPINAIIEKRCSRAAASDIRSGPLKIAKANVEKYGLEDRISLRLGGGLSQIESGEAEEIIIAGMGGIMIRDIISEDIEKARSAERLILQPMNSAPELREYLFNNRFKIICEDIAVEGFKVYNILVCEKGEESAEGIELHIPHKLYSNKNFGMFLNKKIREFTKISTGLENASQRSEADNRTLEIYKKLLNDALEIQRGTGNRR